MRLKPVVKASEFGDSDSSLAEDFRKAQRVTISA